MSSPVVQTLPGLGYISNIASTPVSTAFSDLSASYRNSFNYFKKIIRPAVQPTDTNSVGEFYTFVQANGCGPDLPGSLANLKYSDFSRSVIFGIAINVQNVAQNAYNNAANGQIIVHVFQGTQGRGNFTIELTGPSYSQNTINTITRTFTNLGGSSSTTYTLTITPTPDDSAAVCATTYDITVNSNQVPSFIQRTSPGGVVRYFQNPSSSTPSAWLIYYNKADVETLGFV